MPVFREPGVAAAYDPHALFVNPSSTDPTTDNMGDPLIAGAWYYNTATFKLRVYSGTAWADFATAAGTVTGDLTVTGNLSVGGNTTLGDATGDTLTINPGAVTWTNNPTHSGNHVFSSDVTVHGTFTNNGVPVFARSLATTNAAVKSATFRTNTTGTAAAGLGGQLEFEVENASGTLKSGAFIEAVMTDATNTSEDFKFLFKTMAAGAAATTQFALDSTAAVFTPIVALPNGAVGAPALTFSSDPDTGLYSVGADNLGFTANGVVRGSVSSSRSWFDQALYVGTDAAAGSISNVARIGGGIFSTATGSNSQATGVATTQFTVPSMAGTYGTWIVTGSLAGSNDVANYHAVSLLTCNGSSSVAVAAMKTATLLSITLSGMNLQMTQTSGITSTVSWTATRIA